MACWVVKNGPLTLVANTRSKSASVALAVEPGHGHPGVVHQDVEAAVSPSSVNSASRISKNRPS